ncbi:hypothetical protein IW138_003067 [Coemansia sp. RSA 986]|nr:hypothetical protein IW138_003067 [Coemansia sp. RSA 986]
MTSNVDIEKLKNVCEKIVREGDLDTLTDRNVRRFAEKEFSLEAKALDEKPYKKIIKETVSEVLERLKQESEANNSEDEEPEDEGIESDDNDNSDGEDGDDAVSASSADGDEDDDGAINKSDEEAKARAKRRPTEIQSPPKPKRVKSSSSSKSISAGSKTSIDNLKSYVNKCGLRKVWSKELAGMNGAQQIRHLKKILEDLGMEGRPTVEKCKKIKAKRELQAELAAMNQDNVIDGIDETPEQEALLRNRRSAARKNISYNVDQISDSEESETNDDGAEAEGSEGGDGNSDNNEGSEVEETESESESDAYIENNDSDEAKGKDNAGSDEESANNLEEGESD